MDSTGSVNLGAVPSATQDIIVGQSQQPAQPVEQTPPPPSSEEGVGEIVDTYA